MNVVVRNTFLHLSREADDEDISPYTRSSSAPPTCRHLKLCDDDLDSGSVSTRCKTTVTTSISFGDLDDNMSEPTFSEREEVFPAFVEGEGDRDNRAQSSASSHDTLSQVEAQRRIEEMSQKVMNIWSKLRSAEAPMTTSASVITPEGHRVAVAPAVGTWAWIPAVQPTPVRWNTPCTPCMGALQISGDAQQAAEFPRTSLKTQLAATGQKLDGKAPLFTPSCKPSGSAYDVLASVKELLLLAPGVESVEIQSGAVGTLTTISVQLDSRVTTIDSIVTASKVTLLESAANSDTVYVMGYEAAPFSDLSESVFATMLASMPTSWYHSACWDTYQFGSCPRGKTCKWQHPGKRELQPVRVTVSSSTSSQRS